MNWFNAYFFAKINLMKDKSKNYVIGIDGGGTKTEAALADLTGKILRLAKTGPSSFIKVGVKETVFNITKAIEKLLRKNKRDKIFSTFIGLAAMEENKEMRGVIMKSLLRQPQISRIFQGKVTIGSDQLSGFRSGTDKKDGVVLISGTGSAAHGWRKEKEAHAGGWGWLNDEGSAFWVGQKAYQAVLKDLDGRGPKTLMSHLFLKKFKAKKAGDLKRKIFLRSNLIETVASLALLVDKIVQKKDKTAQSLFIEAGDELFLAAKTVIQDLNFQKKRFPLVLIGGMFKSELILETVTSRIKKFAPEVKFIRPKVEPVIGAIKLAIENLPSRATSTFSSQ
ncbi:hypothetical protein KJA15_03240 [Patescibacteria group bacterium]|nr:hypothetical protein [Patescibacteria group bacterium]